MDTAYDRECYILYDSSGVVCFPDLTYSYPSMSRKEEEEGGGGAGATGGLLDELANFFRVEVASWRREVSERVAGLFKSWKVEVKLLEKKL